MRLGHLSGRHCLLVALLSSALRLMRTCAYTCMRVHTNTHTYKACSTYFGAANLSYLAAAALLLILKAYFFVFHNEIKVEGVELLALHPSACSVADVSLFASLLFSPGSTKSSVWGQRSWFRRRSDDFPPGKILIFFSHSPSRSNTSLETDTLSEKASERLWIQSLDVQVPPARFITQINTQMTTCSSRLPGSPSPFKAKISADFYLGWRMASSHPHHQPQTEVFFSCLEFLLR